jgi:hypothetical protein
MGEPMCSIGWGRRGRLEHPTIYDKMTPNILAKCKLQSKRKLVIWYEYEPGVHLKYNTFTGDFDD